MPLLLAQNDHVEDADNTVVVKNVLDGDEDDKDDANDTPEVGPDPLGRGVRTRMAEVPYQTFFKGQSYP